MIPPLLRVQAEEKSKFEMATNDLVMPQREHSTPSLRMEMQTGERFMLSESKKERINTDPEIRPVTIRTYLSSPDPADMDLRRCNSLSIAI